MLFKLANSCRFCENGFNDVTKFRFLSRFTQGKLKKTFVLFCPGYEQTLYMILNPIAGEENS